VNVLTPLDPSTGAINIQLTNGGNTTAPFAATMQTVAPTFFLFGGTRYAAGTHADGSLLGPRSMSVPGYLFTPAQPSETVTLYGTGCGLPVTAPVQGSAKQSGILANEPAIQIGTSPAAIQFAGLVNPGLCQFNVTLPSSLPDGDQTVIASFGSTSTPDGVLIPIGR
jgi:uncharacterized protein (TIGR03437 family)